MIISASRRTDLPAFHAGWFMERIREGSCEVRNPFNPARVSRVDLRPEAVDAVVFWTRNPGPLMPSLGELDSRGYRYVFLYTITGYPAPIEPGVPPTEEAVETFAALSDRLGPGRVVWRFDPVLVSTATPEGRVIENFEGIARRLAGRTERVITSFAHFYGKVRRRVERVRSETGIGFEDVSEDSGAVERIAAALAESARRHSMDVFSCAQPPGLSRFGLRPGSCIDAGLLGRLFGLDLEVRKDRSQRRECGCSESRDIGAYGTCGHGCVYCYAAGPS